MRYRASLFVACAIALFLLSSKPASASSEFVDGDGSVGNPYQVATCRQLQNIENHLDSHFIMIRDINCAHSFYWNWYESHCTDPAYDNEEDCHDNSHD